MIIVLISDEDMMESDKGDLSQHYTIHLTSQFEGAEYESVFKDFISRI